MLTLLFLPPEALTPTQTTAAVPLLPEQGLGTAALQPGWNGPWETRH